MKVAIAVFKNIVAPRLDFSEKLIIYDIDNGNIKNKRTLNLLLDYSLEIVGLLKEENIDTVICGGGPRGFLRNIYINGIDIINGGFMEPDTAAKMFMENKLTPITTLFGQGKGRGFGNMKKGMGMGFGKAGGFGKNRKYFKKGG
jgi:predicted Fe-Mo cluster-binding NifX family protein